MSPSDGTRRLLLVQPCHESVRKAVAAGFHVWSVRDRDTDDDPLCLAEAERLSQRLLLTDTREPAGLAALLRDAARRAGLSLTLYLGERPGRSAALAAVDAAGLSLTSARSVHRITDPTAMRRLLNESGRSVVRARHARTVTEVLELAEHWPLPLVVKHTGADGGAGVTPIRTPAELTAWTARRPADPAVGPYLLEEFLTGPVFAVHTLTADSMHHVLAITAHQDDGGTVTEVYPAPLDSRERAELRAVATALLDLADYRFGVTCTRMVLTPHGARVVAAEDGLRGAGPDLLRIGAGYDPELWLFRALAGEPVPRPVPQRAAAATEVPPPAGIGTADLASVPYVRYFRTPRPGTGQPGRVAVEAGSPDEAGRRITAVRALWDRAERADGGCGTCSRGRGISAG
ncbi:phosphoribosylglycinamide synthetase [Streptomyces sp. NPDC048665]|uniref:ATP-grasp domain-containing protein n=1 Tax=Streptomyces sp. NPDC048665 TaxID=3155490 RepID=UPI003440719D